MKKIWRDVLILIAFTASVILVIFLMIRFTPAPPVKKMAKAREALSTAGKKKAQTYSGKLYKQARILYDSAMVNWKKQNKRFIYFRDYEKVALFADMAAKIAGESADNSLTSASDLQDRIKQKINSLNDLILKIDKFFTTYPLSSETRNRISKGKMLLQEARVAYKNSEYLQANRKITDSEYLLTSSFDNASENLNNYFRSFHLWQAWAEKTIRESKNNEDYCIIIDKFSRKLYVYNNGLKKMEFDAELGKNWVGTKRTKGDNATPEGMYRITKKFDSRKTKYYKALLLDYPNSEDIAKFKAEIAKGTLPSSAKIGGLIEIHGNGGKGIDWTEGCIALTDKEMDSIFKIVGPGTPVTIVGSMIDLQHVLNK